MGKKNLKALVLSAVMSGMLSFGIPSADAAIQVNPIPGLDPEFAMGADISMLPEMESKGAKFFDVDGTQMDEIQIMKNHGVNWVRVRIWNDPKAGPGGGGNTDEARAIAVCQRAKALGMKTLVNFHYSDFWTDGNQQWVPNMWKDDDIDQLQKDVYEYTKTVIGHFKEAGASPDMIQVGNELKAGFMWPLGKRPSKDGDKAFSSLLAAGLKACRDTDPSITLMVHLPDGGDNAMFREFFDSMNKNGVTDFDVIGFSYYPFWHGTIESLQNNLNDIAARYNKDVIVVETALGYTNEDFDGMKNAYDAGAERLSGFKSTVQGQATGLRTIMECLANVPDGRGKGIFYWEPDWYAVPGVGWKTGEGNNWDNLAMFDKKGKALESWDVFQMVKDPNGTVTPITVKEVEPVKATTGVGQIPQLPDKTTVTFSDDRMKVYGIQWQDTDKTYDKTGEYKVQGTINELNLPIECTLKVADKANLLMNGDFETATLDGWTVTGDTGAVNIVSKEGDSLGVGALHYWNGSTFGFTVSQTVKNLQPGKYTVKVATQGGGGQSTFNLFVIGDNGEKTTVKLKDNGWADWQNGIIKDVEITGGEATVGVELEAAGDTWGSIDNFEFYMQN